MGKSTEAKHTPQQELPLKNTPQTNETRNAVLQNTHPSLKYAPQNIGVHLQMKLGCFWGLGFLMWNKKAQGQRQCHAGPLVPGNQNGKDPTKHSVTSHFL